MTRAEFRALALSVALALMRRFEGFYSHPYLCSAGVPTIGYGTTYYENGRAVTLNDAPITRQRAEQLLQHQVRTIYLPTVLKLCPHIDTPERLAAVIDWCYNLGGRNLAASTMRKRINAGDWTRAKVEIMRWTRAGGRVLRGLILRRQAEAALM